MASDCGLVAAVVLNYGNAGLTLDCVDSLIDGDDAGLRILIVDNGSPADDLTALRSGAEERQVTVHELPRNVGFGAGMNAGARAAIADPQVRFILLLNNDTVVGPDAVPLLRRTLLQRPDAAAVTPLVTHHDGETVWAAGGDLQQPWLVARPRHGGRHIVDVPDGVREVDFLPGAALLLTVDAFRRSGGFREDFFMYSEDVDLSIRLRAEGYELLVQPRALVRHRVRGGATSLSEVFYYYSARNRLWLVRTHVRHPLVRAAAILAHLAIVHVRLLRVFRRREGALLPPWRLLARGIRDGLFVRPGDQELALRAPRRDPSGAPPGRA